MPKLGERAVTSLSVKHPTLAVLLPIIEQTRKTTLLRGWWFNKYAYTAYPDTDGAIALGDLDINLDGLDVTPQRYEWWKNRAMRCAEVLGL